jgi:hypothetical protein
MKLLVERAATAIDQEVTEPFTIGNYPSGGHAVNSIKMAVKVFAVN